jgi:hypothetical protein
VRLLNCKSRWCLSDPLARFARVSPSRGENAESVPQATLPLTRGRAAEGGRGSLKHHLELQNAPYEQPLVEPQLRHL